MIEHWKAEEYALDCVRDVMSCASILVDGSRCWWKNEYAGYVQRQWRMNVISYCIAHFWMMNERNCGIRLMPHAVNPLTIRCVTVGFSPLMHSGGVRMNDSHY